MTIFIQTLFFSPFSGSKPSSRTPSPSVVQNASSLIDIGGGSTPAATPAVPSSTTANFFDLDSESSATSSNNDGVGTKSKNGGSSEAGKLFDDDMFGESERYMKLFGGFIFHSPPFLFWNKSSRIQD